MGNQLSGGEQQMLAIGRALMTNPKLLILDEATEGLAPLIRAEIWACLARLKSEGQAILLVDKHLDALAKIADRHVMIEKGHVVWSGTSAALDRDRSCSAICRCERPFQTQFRKTMDHTVTHRLHWGNTLRVISLPETASRLRPPRAHRDRCGRRRETARSAWAH